MQGLHVGQACLMQRPPSPKQAYPHHRLLLAQFVPTVSVLEGVRLGELQVL